jgi:hypothetical protein
MPIRAQPQHRILQAQEAKGGGHRRQHHQDHDRHRQRHTERSRITKQRALGILFVIASSPALPRDGLH